MAEACRSNAMTQTDALENHFQKTIVELKNAFTFHEFVLSLAKNHQHEYIDALVKHKHKHKEKPFQSLHSELERRLHSNSEKYGIRLLNRKCSSEDIFGTSSYCGQWKRTKP